jgi:DNA-directed RNA polymerase specialized sigma24 family protein
MNELSLALDVQSAHHLGFEELFTEHFNQVFSYEMRLVGDLAIAHKLSEETFAEMARYYRGGKVPNEPRALLYLLATARARNHLRHGDRPGLFQRLFSRSDDPVVEFTEEDTSALTNDTAQRAMTTLEFSSQVILLLHDYCGLTYDEVARAAGIGRSAVPRDLDRARHEFKQAYDYISF